MIKRRGSKSARRKGNASENRAADIVRTWGLEVTLARQSSFPDLIAYNGNHLLFIEVKTNRFPGKQEVERIKNLQTPMGSIKMLCIYYPKNSKANFWIIDNKGSLKAYDGMHLPIQDGGAGPDTIPPRLGLDS